MQESFWWWQCSDRYIVSLSPHLHAPFPPFSPSLISLMVSVDVKHHVYLLRGGGWGERFLRVGWGKGRVGFVVGGRGERLGGGVGVGVLGEMTAASSSCLPQNIEKTRDDRGCWHNDCYSLEPPHIYQHRQHTLRPLLLLDCSPSNRRRWRWGGGREEGGKGGGMERRESGQQRELQYSAFLSFRGGWRLNWAIKTIARKPGWNEWGVGGRKKYDTLGVGRGGGRVTTNQPTALSTCLGGGEGRADIDRDDGRTCHPPVRVSSTLRRRAATATSWRRGINEQPVSRFGLAVGR